MTSKRSLLVRAVISLVLATAVFVVSPRCAIAASGETEIRQWLDQWTRAFEARDSDALASLYAADVIAYDIVPPLQYVGRDAYIKDYAEFFAQYDGLIEVKVIDLHIMVGSDVAFAEGLEHVKGKLKSGQTMDMWQRFTSGFRKQNGKWLDVHDHVSVPTDFATGKSVMDLKP